MLGDKIKLYRENKKMTQNEIANILDVSPATVSKYESGALEPNIESLKRLAELFEISIDELLNDEEDKFDISKINVLDILREQKEMKLKGNLYTRIKKHMTKKMYYLYYRENREASQSKEEYEANLLRAYRHLDACRFKNKGWPCPTCPSCCFCGKDYETMTEVMDFAREWMKENPDKARFMKPPKFLHKH